MYQLIRFDTGTLLVRSSAGSSLLRRSFFLISVVLLSLCIPAVPAQAQLPKIFAADDPGGLVSSGGANIAYLQNTTGSDVTLMLDGNTIINKAHRLNIFDKSSGSWVQRVILNQQSQPISIFTRTNTFLTGLYAYYKLNESNGSALDASVNGRTLSNWGNTIGTITGIINGARNFPGTGGANLVFAPNTTDFSPGSITSRFRSG
jgi:hypothetical protein